jgi:hypothetical protein
LLGLFWYWASSLIGDDDTNPPATEQAQVDLINSPTFTPTPTEEVTLSAETAVPIPEPSPTPGQLATDRATRTPRPTQPPEDEPTPEEGVFAEGDTVVVTDDGVRLRAEPSTSADIIEEMDRGTELVIIGGSQEADGFIWWQVEDQATDREGWVAQDFIERA